MKKLIALLSICLMTFGMNLSAADNTYLDYQNYNHGYCADCNCEPCDCAPCDSCPQPCDPCDPCAPVCGTDCGISICAIAVGVVAVAAAAAIVITAGSGSSSSHS